MDPGLVYPGRVPGLDEARRSVWRRLRALAVPVGLGGLVLGCDASEPTAGEGHHGASHVEVHVGRAPPPAVDDHDHDHDHDAEDHEPSDHDAEERARCPSGTWCAAITDAKLFWVEGAETSLKCPKKLVANPGLDMPRGDPRFKGFSRNIHMRAELDREATLERRDAGEDDICCYDWLDHCLGRPPLTHAGAIVPAAAEREEWLARAQLEWFSVASFVRMAEALAHRGAPRALVEAHIEAAKQEQIHAELCCELAGVDPATLPPLPELEPLDDGLLVREALVSGAIGESLAVAEALAFAREASGRTREVWEQIAEDEAGHAALGLAVVAWWTARAGPDLLRAQLDELEAAELGSRGEQVLHRIVAPMLDQLGAHTTQRA